MAKARRSSKNIMSFLMGRSRYNNDKSADIKHYVPDDIKEGHFAVMAVDSEEPRRFVVPLTYLEHPRFRKLLELAAEEFGFHREGALAIPCTPDEIETILADESDPRVGVMTNHYWSSCNSMVQTY